MTHNIAKFITLLKEIARTILQAITDRKREVVYLALVGAVVAGVTHINGGVQQSIVYAILGGMMGAFYGGITALNRVRDGAIAGAIFGLVFGIIYGITEPQSQSMLRQVLQATLGYALLGSFAVFGFRSWKEEK